MNTDRFTVALELETIEDAKETVVSINSASTW